jgi:hypothetical protein
MKLEGKKKSIREGKVGDVFFPKCDSKVMSTL